MRIGIVVNDAAAEKAGHTTARLAVAATNLGHETWVMGAGDLVYDPDDAVQARARRAPGATYKTSESYLRDLRSGSALERITVDDLDVLLLRIDPAGDVPKPWAATAAVLFGGVALRHGVLVLNDPRNLSRAMGRTYFQTLPEEVRPRTLITRDRQEIREFARQQRGGMVLKPLQGIGGRSVVLVRPADLPDLDRMIDSVSRDGYVIAEEHVSAAAEGSTRLWLINGLPLRCKGRYAAFRRERDGRSGVTVCQALVDDAMLGIAEMVRPRLVSDGMFLAGLDIAGDKLIRINVFCPGGLGSAQNLEGVNFARGVIEALERKSLAAFFAAKNAARLAA